MMLKLFDYEKPNLAELSEAQTALRVENLSLHFGNKPVLHNINIKIPKNQITAFIGQSGCGKSTLLACFNRMNELASNCVVSGSVYFNNRNIYTPRENLSRLRARIGMVFQKPNPFPMNVYDNVSYGLRLQGMKMRRHMDDAVERALIDAALWDEVKDRLFEPAYTLSGGQQQRLVIARALALQPEILLLDEPTSALDPLTTLIIEELMVKLKQRCTVVIVTHNMQQAARVSDYTAFLHQGEVVEFNDSDTLFTLPEKKKTEDYISGRYG